VFLRRDERRQGRDDFRGDIGAHGDQKLRAIGARYSNLAGILSLPYSSPDTPRTNPLCVLAISESAQEQGEERLTANVRTRSVACDDLSVVSDGGELSMFDCP
jgi:hypothetical protein